VNGDRFWLGFIAGLLFVGLLSELCLWVDKHLIFVR